MKNQKELTQKGLMNLVLITCAGYLVTAGAVGFALFENNTGSIITASTQSQSPDEDGAKLLPTLETAAISSAKAEEMSKATKADGSPDDPSVAQSAAGSDTAEQQTKAETDANVTDAGNSAADGAPEEVETEASAKKDNFKRHYDKKILDAAAERAAEKIGGLRGSVDVGSVSQLEKPVLPKVNKIIRQEPRQTQRPLILQRPAWQPENGTAKPLPPIVSNEWGDGVDMTATGSITKASDEAIGENDDNFKNWELRR